MACDKISCCSLFAVSGHNRFHMSVVVIIVSKKAKLAAFCRNAQNETIILSLQGCTNCDRNVAYHFVFLHFLQQCDYN